MSDFRELSDTYLARVQVITEANYNNAREWDQQRKKQISGLTPKTDLKNSTAMRTSMLPGNNGGDFSAARMGSGAEIANEEEMANVKGYGPIKKSDAWKIVHKLLGEIDSLILAKKYQQVQDKLDMANTVVDQIT